MAFFEAHFSNFIGSPDFPAVKVHRIIETGQLVGGRHTGSLEVLGTYQLCSNVAGMRVVPQSAGDLLTILQRRHAQPMRTRLGKRPVQWQEYANQAELISVVDTSPVHAPSRGLHALTQTE